MENTREIKTLYLVYNFPYPPRSGYDQRVFNLCRNLSAHMEQYILCRDSEPIIPKNLKALATYNVHAESIHSPRPSLLQKIIKGILFFPSKYPFRAAGWYFPALKKRLVRSITKNNFDLIVLEGTWLGVYWPDIFHSRAIKILDLHNLEQERLFRETKILPMGLKKWFHIHDALKMRFLENQLIKQSNMVLVTSAIDRQKILKKFPQCHVHVAPNGVDCQALQPLPTSNHDEILFVGLLNYLPNVDAVIFFAKSIFPKLRNKHPHLVFRVVGRAPLAEIMALQDEVGIEITGEVDDLKPYYKSSALCIVPLRAGAGTRLKILEAMAYGRPVVSTTIGCEGIEVEHNKHLLIADTDQEISTAISEILNSPELATNLSKNGRSLVEKKYSWDSIATELAAEYQRLL